jgi:hypothetical protein
MVQYDSKGRYNESRWDANKFSLRSGESGEIETKWIHGDHECYFNNKTHWYRLTLHVDFIFQNKLKIIVTPATLLILTCYYYWCKLLKFRHIENLTCSLEILTTWLLAGRSLIHWWKYNNTPTVARVRIPLELFSLFTLTQSLLNMQFICKLKSPIIFLDNNSS